MQSDDGRDSGEVGEVILVDPSLFTAPYDARLSEGLESVGLVPIWATRGLRPGEEDDLGSSRRVHRFFYPLTDGARRRGDHGAKRLKGVEHLVGLARLVSMVRRVRPRAVHVHWGLVPRADRLAIRAMRRTCPVVVTVHDTEPFNGKDVAAAQRAGFYQMLAAADHLIVHTAAGRRTLVASGLDADRISVVPHGLLGTSSTRSTAERGATRWTIVQFGKIQSYKGVDLLVEALGLLSTADRARLRVIVAGEPLVDAAALQARAAALGLADVIEWRLHYQSGDEVTALLDEADAFVFPYRAIEASGAFLLVAGLGKWIVASDLGAFAETIGNDGGAGALVPPGDVDALAKALAASIGRRPARSLADDIVGWDAIGRMTADVYRVASERWRDEHGGL